MMQCGPDILYPMCYIRYIRHLALTLSPTQIVQGYTITDQRTAQRSFAGTLPTRDCHHVHNSHPKRPEPPTYLPGVLTSNSLSAILNGPVLPRCQC